MNKKIIIASVAVGVILIVCVAVAVAVLSPKEESEEDVVPGDPINPADYAAADLLVEDPYEMKDEMQNAKMFEGDIANIDTSVGQNAIRGQSRRWPNGNIPYVIASSFSSRERATIAKAMKEYHDKTCIKFVPRTRESAYINIMKGGGCYSSVGRTSRKQDVSLGPGCVHTHIIVHEFMHALGFFHEQSRTDRDKYVTIHWDNIIPSMKHNFNSYGQDKIDHLGASYDLCSVMHYFDTAFAKARGLKTITKKTSGGCVIGRSRELSDTDMRKLNTLYKCSGKPQVGGGVTGPPIVTPTPTPAGCKDNYKSCKNWAKYGFCKGKYASWMAVNCAQACGKCGAACSDLRSNCQRWANGGWCPKIPGYMNKYCAKSCNKC